MDLIDRQALLDAFDCIDWYSEHDGKLTKGSPSAAVSWIKLSEAVEAIDFTPTVEPKRGEWELFVEKSFNGEVVEVDDCGWRCSHCKTPLADAVGGYWDDDSEKPTVNFCPDCGARMDVRKEDDNGLD